MDYSEIPQKPSNDTECFGFDCENNVKSHKFASDLMKLSLVKGADMAPMAQKSSGKSIGFDGIVDHNNKFVNFLKLIYFSMKGYNEFPLNIATFLAILAIKLTWFQMKLLLKFLTFSLWFSYFSIMLFLFPRQTLSRIRMYLRRKIMGIFYGIYLRATSFIFVNIKAQRSMLKMGIRFGWGAFWAMYVCILLFVLLVTGFAIGGITMKRLVENPIRITEPLHFDYTMASPAAFVPILSPLDGGMVASEGSGARAIPFNHKLQLTVSLTLPESDYNRKIGVFQVKVEYMSADGKISGISSYPCILQFKSQQIRVADTFLKTVPLITGFQSEVQNLEVQINDFTEGHDPTSSLRVSLVQRAEYKSGAGIPEVFAASISLRSELPRFKKIVWSWRRTVFVWISLMSFIMELLVMSPCSLRPNRARFNYLKMVHPSKDRSTLDSRYQGLSPRGLSTSPEVKHSC